MLTHAPPALVFFFMCPFPSSRTRITYLNSAFTRRKAIVSFLVNFPSSIHSHSKNPAFLGCFRISRILSPCPPAPQRARSSPCLPLFYTPAPHDSRLRNHLTPTHHLKSRSASE